MQWIEVCIKTTSQAIELVGERLTMLGFDSFIMDDQDEFHEFLENNKQYWDYVDEGLEKTDAGSEPDPALPRRLSLPHRRRSPISKISCGFPQQYPSIEFGTLDVSLEHVKDEDWENNWKQYYQPLKIGSKLLVVPEWLHPENPEHRVEVLLDPGMIFGTGAHASTQMCMEELERAIQGGEEVLDLGSGSGILSITALLLGAEHATGVDIDPKAEDIARQNAAINQLGPDRFTALTGDVIGDKAMMEKLQKRYDIVLANIVADVIIPLAPAAAEFDRRQHLHLLRHFKHAPSRGARSFGKGGYADSLDPAAGRLVPRDGRAGLRNGRRRDCAFFPIATSGFSRGRFSSHLPSCLAFWR